MNFIIIMHKESIADLLEDINQSLIKFLEQQDLEQWQKGPEGERTTGQLALHLLQSIKPLNDALSMPKILLRYKFGKANREVYNYETVVKHYQEFLKDSKAKTFRDSQNMRIPSVKEKKYILTRLQMESKKLQYKTRKLSDKHLDTLMLPHPLMGKMPVRELIMWAAHYFEYHTRILKESY